MKRKFTVLTLVVALVFTMTMPSFAATSALQVVGKGLKTVQNLTGVSYCALGDSIAAGCKNTDFDALKKSELKDDQQFYSFMQRDKKTDERSLRNEDTGIKITDPYAVEFSCVARIAKKINASSTKSMNGAFVALRSKDVCRILGILPDAEKAYEGDAWGQYVVMDHCPALFLNEANQTIYRKGIAKADVITVELGENDMSAMLLNDLAGCIDYSQGRTKFNIEKSQIFGLIGKVFATIPDAVAAAKLTNDAKEQLEDIVTAIFKKDSDAFTTAKNALIGDLKKAKELGCNFATLANEGLNFYKTQLNESQKYFNMLMSYINEHKKPGAIVVVGTLINPFTTADTTSISSGNNGTLYAVLVDVLGVFIKPYIDLMNSYIYSNAQKSTYNIFTHKTIKDRKYYVADLRAVDLNPPADSNGTRYEIHPNAHGQQMIADAFLEQIYKAQAAKGNKVADTKAKVTSVKNVVTNTVATVKAVKIFINNIKDLAAKISAGDFDLSELGKLI